MGEHDVILCGALFVKRIEIFLSHINDKNKLKIMDFLFLRFNVLRHFWILCKIFVSFDSMFQDFSN